LVSGDKKNVCEEHHPREELRGRFETNKQDHRRLSGVLLLELQRHPRVFHREAASEDECQNKKLERRGVSMTAFTQMAKVNAHWMCNDVSSYVFIIDNSTSMTFLLTTMV
jgi:hypothetical protein